MSSRRSRSLAGGADIAELAKQVQQLSLQFQNLVDGRSVAHDRDVNKAIVLDGACPAPLQACNPEAEAKLGRTCPDMRSYAPDPLIVDSDGRVCYAPEDLQRWAGKKSMGDIDYLIERGSQELLAYLGEKRFLDKVMKDVIKATKAPRTSSAASTPAAPVPPVVAAAIASPVSTARAALNKLSPSNLLAALRRSAQPAASTQPAAAPVVAAVSTPVTVSAASSAGSGAGSGGNWWDNSPQLDVDDCENPQTQNGVSLCADWPAAATTLVASSDLDEGLALAAATIVGKEVDGKQPLYAQALRDAVAGEDYVFTIWNNAFSNRFARQRAAAYKTTVNPTTMEFAGVWAWAKKQDMAEGGSFNHRAQLTDVVRRLAELNAYLWKNGAKFENLCNLTFTAAWPLITDPNVGVDRLEEAVHALVAMVDDDSEVSERLQAINSCSQTYHELLREYKAFKARQGA